MKSDLFTKKFLESIKDSFVEDRTDVHDPYEKVLSDLERIELTELVLSSKTFESLINNLKKVNYWDIDGVPTINSDIIEKIENFIFNMENSIWKIKFQVSLKEIPQDYGIRGKAAELMLLL